MSQLIKFSTIERCTKCTNTPGCNYTHMYVAETEKLLHYIVCLEFGYVWGIDWQLAIAL